MNWQARIELVPLECCWGMLFHISLWLPWYSSRDQHWQSGVVVGRGRRAERELLYSWELLFFEEVGLLVPVTKF